MKFEFKILCKLFIKSTLMSYWYYLILEKNIYMHVNICWKSYKIWLYSKEYNGYFNRHPFTIYMSSTKSMHAW